jgi:hypothetical protein
MISWRMPIRTSKNTKLKGRRISKASPGTRKCLSKAALSRVIPSKTIPNKTVFSKAVLSKATLHTID